MILAATKIPGEIDPLIGVSAGTSTDDCRTNRDAFVTAPKTAALSEAKASRVRKTSFSRARQLGTDDHTHCCHCFDVTSAPSDGTAPGGLRD